MYSFTSRVRYSEITEQKELSILSIINYFQDCCNFESEDLGVGIEWLAERNTAWMLTNWQIRIPKRPINGQRIRIHTRACGFRLFIGKRNFTITDEETGELLVYAYSEWAYVNLKTGRPERDIPQKERDAYGMAEPLEMDFAKGKLEVPVGMQPAGEIVVTERNLDTNHHVNNGEYIEIALSMLPDGTQGRVKELRAEYKQQSKLGDKILAERFMDENGCIVVLKGEDEKKKLVVRFGF